MLIARSQTKMTFAWEAPTDNGGLELLSYTIYMAKDDDRFSALTEAPVQFNPSITIHTEDELEPGNLYRFKVSASNFVGEGPLSS